ncbi:uncharacterized protein LOC141718221 [Apium graveolens]|uniref:uncharacterized protein LOC141718221 n=1 Tax=Apium graveolens TaxID=4045 RepID=UPI003D7BE20E
MRMSDTHNVDEFCMKLNVLKTNIHTLAETIEESYVVKKILKATSSKFLQITSAIEQFGKMDEMTVMEIVRSLKAHEERLHGQPLNAGSQYMRSIRNLKEIQRFTDPSPGRRTGLIGQRAKFKELDEKVTGKVKFGDGSTVKIKGKGSVMFICKTGGEVMLREVYYVPNLYKNIISLGHLSESGNKVVLSGTYLWVNDPKGRILMKAMMHLSDKGMARGLPKLVQPKTICTACLMTKQTRNPFPTIAEFQATRILELVPTSG